jgi:hypothetical protein
MRYEHPIAKIGGGAESVLQQLEAGDAMRVDCDQLAIDHRVLRDLLQRLGDGRRQSIQ